MAGGMNCRLLGVEPGASGNPGKRAEGLQDKVWVVRGRPMGRIEALFMVAGNYELILCWYN